MNAPYASLPIDALMRRHFISVEPESTVEDVLRLMALARVRILPVVRRGVLVGVVGYRTLALSLLGRSTGDAVTGTGAPSIAALMEQPGATVTAKAATETAARRLCETGLGCLPVVEADAEGLRIVGLVTESDLLAAAFDGRGGPPVAVAPAPS